MTGQYPANPPAIGHEETIQARGTLYLVMVSASVVLLAGSVLVGRRLSTRLGNWNAALLSGVLFVITIGVVMTLLPAVGELSVNVAHHGNHASETPPPLTDASGRIVYPGFPADVLAGFRLYSIGTQVVLWTALALAFAPLADRLLAPTERHNLVTGQPTRRLV